MLRLLLTALIVYLGYRFIKSIWPSSSPKEEVKGRNKNQPLDLRDSDVDEARFEDMNGKE